LLPQPAPFSAQRCHSYGDKVSGWWIDGCYDYTNYTEAKLRPYHDAIRAGNPAAVIGMNNGVKHPIGGASDRVSQWADITCGESDDFTEVPRGRFVHQGGAVAQWHELGFLGSTWAGPGACQCSGGMRPSCDGCTPLNSTYMRAYTRAVAAMQGALTVDLQLLRNGSMNAAQVAVLAAAWLPSPRGQGTPQTTPQEHGAVAFGDTVPALTSPAPVPVEPVFTAPVIVGSSHNSSTHFWFPQALAAFFPPADPAVGGVTSDYKAAPNGTPPAAFVLQVSLQDDGCRDKTCRTCHKPCSPPSLERVSTDGGATWAASSTRLPVGAAAVQLGPMEVMTTAHFGRETARPGEPFTGAGTTLYYNASARAFTSGTTSRNITFSGLPIGLEANATSIIRWCAVASLANGTSVEVVQVELGMINTPRGMVKNRALTLFGSADNFTWTYAGIIAKHSEAPFMQYDNGPCEPAVSVLKDGRSLLVVFRVDSFANYHFSTSFDAGGTWITPASMPLPMMGSVRPRLHTIGSHTILVGGRPGLMMWIMTAGGPWVDVGVRGQNHMSDRSRQSVARCWGVC